MAQISEIKVSDLEGALRIDPEFYKPVFLKLFHNNLQWFELREISHTVDLQSNGAFKVIFDTLNDGNKKTIPYVRSGNVGDFFIKKENLEKISEQAHSKLTKTHTRKGDILMARKGKIGGATLVTEDDVGYNTNDNIVNIRIDNNSFNKEFIVAYLNCHHGLRQVERLSTGNVQPWLSMAQLRSLRVPLVRRELQSKISKLIDKAFLSYKHARKQYSQAEQLLLQELGLENSTPEWVAGYETDYNNVLEVARIDAEYFQPRYEVVKEKIRGVDHDVLGNLVKPLKKGIEVGSAAYTNEGIPFMRISNISAKTIDYGSAKYISTELFDELKDKYCPKQGEILLSKDGTPGIAYHVTSEMEVVICGGIVRLKSTKLEPEYLALVLNSRIVQSQIEQEAGGALIKHWRPDQIKKTLIPILSQEKRDKITTLVKDSFSALHESRQLLEQAKREVEEMIEDK